MAGKPHFAFILGFFNFTLIMIMTIIFPLSVDFQLTSESVAEWRSRQAHLNEVGNFLIESTAPQTSRSLAEELRRLNMQWAEFMKRNTFVSYRTRRTCRCLISSSSLLLSTFCFFNFCCFLNMS